MRYLAILDYHHLDHSIFMKSFAEAMARQQGCSAIILHADSPYTDRLMQTGIMRGDARIRSTKDLNNRIIALLADNGIAGIGVNGYQKNIVRLQEDGNLAIDNDWLNDRPSGTHLVLSNLVLDESNTSVVPVPLPVLANTLNSDINSDAVILFSNDETDEVLLPENQTAQNSAPWSAEECNRRIPDDLIPPPENSFLSTSTAFGSLPDMSRLQKIG